MTVFGSNIAWDYQQKRTEQLARTAAFEKSALALDPAVRRLNQALIAGRDPASAKAAISSNVMEQFKALHDAEPYLPASASKVTSDYRSNLVNLNELLPEVRDVLTSGPFLQEVAYTFENREPLIAALRVQAKLPVQPPAQPLGNNQDG